MKIDIHDNLGNTRSRELEFGSYVIGSDFDCDIVLVDEGINPKHLLITFAKDGLKVSAIENSKACFAKDDTALDHFPSDKPVTWKAAQEVWIADLVLRQQAPAKKRFNLYRSAVTTGVAVCALAAFLIVLPPQDADSFATEGRPVEAEPTDGFQGFADSSQAVTEMSKMLEVAQGSIIDLPKSVLKTEKNDIPPISSEAAVADGLLNEGTEVEGVSERTQAEGETNDVASVTETDAEVKSHLLRAVDIVLNAMAFEAKIESFEDGVLMLSSDGLDRKRFSEIESALLQDVPGVRSVSFEGAQVLISDDIVDLIIGVWYSKDSYVILFDGRTVRPGEEIQDGVKLMKVDSMSDFTVSKDNVEERITL